MLKHFKVNNFKNFKDDLDIDFSDVNGYKFSQDCITHEFDWKNDYLMVKMEVVKQI